jgi:hypothetical protein
MGLMDIYIAMPPPPIRYCLIVIMTINYGGRCVKKCLCSCAFPFVSVPRLSVDSGVGGQCLIYAVPIRDVADFGA